VHSSQGPTKSDELQLAHGTRAPLQACSILYKTKLPLLLVFNKVDVARHEFAVEWMRDYEAFSEALQKDTSYAATLSRSLSLVTHSSTTLRLKFFWILTKQGCFFLLCHQCTEHAAVLKGDAGTLQKLQEGARFKLIVDIVLSEYLRMMCLQVLEEFYENLQSVGVSAATGEGMDEFFQKVQACRKEYMQQYLPELQRRQKVSIVARYSLSWPGTSTLP